MENKILIGSLENPSFVFLNEDLLSVDGVSVVDLVGNELSIDELTPRIFHVYYDMEAVTYSDYDYIESSDGYVMCSNSIKQDLRKIPYGTPIYWFIDDELLMKMCVRNIERTSRDEYLINAVSVVGLAEGQYHTGNMYTGQTFAEIAEEIIDGLFSYVCEDDVASTRVYGWLPYDTKRRNLHQLLIATSACMTRGEDGGIIFSYLYDTQPSDIDLNDTYLDGAIDYSAAASKVIVTEHTFQPLLTANEIKLFDNSTEPVINNKLIVFNEPILINPDSPNYGLTVTGSITISEAGVNYCIASGNGTISGKPYTHMTQLVEQTNNAVQTEKVITLENATLVSVANSYNVAKRLLAYYSERKIVKSSIKKGDKTCGRKVQFMNPYGEVQTGYISKMDLIGSSFVKANVEIITDYVPIGQGNAFSNAIVLTGSGTLTFSDQTDLTNPSNPKIKVGDNIKAVLIGGGQGGSSGYNGKDGGRLSNTGSYGVGGEGGEQGIAGKGGNVLVQLIPTEGKTSLNFACGLGGVGGIAVAGSETYTLGQSGGNTTLGTYSSASGSPIDTGYLNVIDGITYGSKGKEDAVKGGNGGQRGTSNAESVTFNGSTWIGGANATNHYDTGEDIYGGGGGGGAAYGNNGSSAPSNDTAVNGGNGANASARPTRENATYGTGGDAGFGGGGGGGAGGRADYSWASGTYYYSGTPGTGGLGGQGSPGKNGCIIVFF